MATRTWYCCIIVDVAPLATQMNGKYFRHGQHASIAQLDDAGEQWMLFDGQRYVTALAKDLAKAALKTERNRENQRVLVPKEMERRFSARRLWAERHLYPQGRFW